MGGQLYPQLHNLGLLAMENLQRLSQLFCVHMQNQHINHFTIKDFTQTVLNIL